MKELVKLCLTKKYADFSTRATRKEFWSFVLFFYILCICLLGIYFILDMLFDSIQVYLLTVRVAFILSLLLVIPMGAVIVRRLHDTGRSGWSQYLFGLPFIGIIIMLIMLCQKSDEDNKYGPKPIS